MAVTKEASRKKIRQALDESEASARDLAPATTDTNFDEKPATGHDMPSAAASEALSNLRPSIVQGESTTEGALPTEIVVEEAFHKVTGMTVPMGQQFEPQFMASYIPRIIPWACNYSCGGADYPGLFTKSDVSEPPSKSPADANTEQRWRRTNGEALLTPGLYAQMLATRSEMQLAADWMLVPVARSQHWRWQVLQSAFIVCKQRLAPDADRQQNVTNLIDATKKIWERISTNAVIMAGVKKTSMDESKFCSRTTTLVSLANLS